MQAPPHKAGFVNIVGQPNVGKSTLMNALVGERLAVINAKAQTTRHRLVGILSGEDFQIVYTDTPGIIAPKYALQQTMMRAVAGALADADVLLWVVDVRAPVQPLGTQQRPQGVPVLLLVNKVDLVSAATRAAVLQRWGTQVAAEAIDAVIPVAALQGHNMALVLEHVLACLPVHPAYYPKDMLTDRPERFFVAEIVRGQILRHYHQEIPYSVEVVVETFKQEPTHVSIGVVINVARQSQKGILIGHGGKALKQLGTAARLALEQFLGQKVFLAQYVKVVPDWRTKPHCLRQFGYGKC